MKEIESIISSFVESQFPDFYKSEGPRFIDFVRQYYTWMESENQALKQSRSLFNIRDIDKTREDFLVYFKEKYFQQLPKSLQANTQLLTKFATDFYNVKGTSRGVELVLRGIFNEEARVSFPGEDIFRLSNGEWVRPVYLELSVSERTKTFVNQEIVGFNSGAKAFIEVLVRRRINTKIIDVAYISNVRGDFQTGEVITLSSNTSVDNAPTVIGSMNSLEVLTGGAGFEIGDTFNVISSNGKQGKARVSGITDKSGTVSFLFDSVLEDGGWGYFVNTEPVVSTKVLTLRNQYNSNNQLSEFDRFETVQQVLANIEYDTATPNNSSFIPGAVIENYNGNGTVNASAIVVSSSQTNTTAGYIVVAPQVGNIAAVDTTFSIQGNGTTAVITTYTNRTVTGNVVGSNSTLSYIVFNAASDVSNTNDTIVSLDHPFINNQLVVYKAPVGNTAISGLTHNSTYYVINTTNTTFQLSSTYAGSNVNITSKAALENGHIIETRTGFIGLTNLPGSPFVVTPYANLVGLTTNTTAVVANISSGSDANLSIGTITDTETVLLNPDLLNNKNTGNVVFHTLRLNGYNSNVGYFGTDTTFNASLDVNSTTDTIAISSASNYTTDMPVLYIVDSGNTAVSPLVSNTVYYIQAANATHVSLKATKSGSLIQLTAGSSETGHHLIGPLVEVTTGDQAGSIAYQGLGFLKFPASSMDSVILDCLRFVSANIGTIASLTSINPGTNYNTDPFIAIVEPLTYGYQRRDYIMSVQPLSGAFIVGEQVEQTIDDITIILTITNWSSSGSANGGSPTNYEVPEYVFQEYANGAVRAYGFVREAGIASGSGTVRLANVVGTFVTTSNSSTYIYSGTTASTSNATLVTVSTDTARARALVKPGSNSTYLKLKRINLENTFTVNSTAYIVGRSSGATANVLSIGEDSNSLYIGINANITANAVTSNGVVTELDVFDSGFGYINDETVTLTRADSAFEVTAAVRLNKQGQGEGFFLSTKGFLDADKKIHDNFYYQEFSYDIETKIPFDQYFNVLSELAHVAGTKAFGTVVSLSKIDTSLLISSEVSLEESEGSYVHSYTSTFAAQTYTGNFTGVYSAAFTSQFSGNFTNEFTSLIYTGLFASFYTGDFTQSYSTLFTRQFSGTFTTPYVTDYTRSYSVLFTGLLALKPFVGSYTSSFTNVYNNNYTGVSIGVPYSGSFQGSIFSGSFLQGTYSSIVQRSFIGIDSFSGAPVIYSGSYIGQFSKQWTKNFTATWTRNFAGEFTGQYQNTFTVQFNNQFSVTYTGGFQQPFTSVYSKTYSSQFTAVFTGLFASSYGRAFSTVYTRPFTKNYTGRYTIAYTNSFTNTFNDSFTVDYSGIYTQPFTAESYTRLFTGAYQPVLYTGSFSQLYSGIYTQLYTIVYSAGYSQSFTGVFTSLFNNIYSRAFTSPFTKTFTTGFTASFTKTTNYTNNFSLVSYSSDLFTAQFTRTFGTTYSRPYTGSFIGDTYSRVFNTYSSAWTSNYSSNYTGTFGGFTKLFSGAFSKTFNRAFSRTYTTDYTGAFSSGFSGMYSSLFTAGFTSPTVYTKIYTSTYSGAYSGYSPIVQEFASSFTSSFTQSSYTKTYSKLFTGLYGNFTGSYLNDFTQTFVGMFSRTYTMNQYTGIEYTGVYGG